MQCCPGAGGGCDGATTEFFFDMESNQPPRRHRGAAARRMTITSQSHLSAHMDDLSESVYTEYSHTREMPTSIMIVNEQDRKRSMQLLNVQKNERPKSLNLNANEAGSFKPDSMQYRMQSMPQIQANTKLNREVGLDVDVTNRAPEGPLLETVPEYASRETSTFPDN